MKYKLLFITMLLTTALFSQRDGERSGDRGQQIEGMRIAYLTKQMDLSPEDAQVFWPIFNKYEDKMKAMRGGERFKKMDTSAVSDSEAQNLYKKRLEMAEQKVKLTKEMVAELEQHLTPNQILSLLKAEDSFKKEVLTRVKQRMGERRHEEY